jgi:Sulfatase-modifying factor enzyme 1
MKARTFLFVSPLVVLLACGGTTASPSGGSGGSAGAGAGGSTASGGAAGSPFGGTGGENPFGGSGPGGVAGTSGSSGAAGAPSCAARCGETGCPACQGPTLISTHDDRGNPYRIDSTEVTNAQYSKFLEAQVDPASQPAYCASWNTAFAPDDEVKTGCQDLYDPLNRPNYPVVCVNWCDADAYCRWAGKRLCQDFSYEQLPVPDISRPAQKWGLACTGGATDFPYGNTYQPTACNGPDYGANKLLPVASLPGCVGALPGLYDMSGNAAEWVGNCGASTGPNDLCVAAGGAFEAPQQSDLQCSAAPTYPRSAANYVVGFRCCAN